MRKIVIDEQSYPGHHHDALDATSEKLYVIQGPLKELVSASGFSLEIISKYPRTRLLHDIQQFNTRVEGLQESFRSIYGEFAALIARNSY